jgi:cell filamentation protein
MKRIDRTGVIVLPEDLKQPGSHGRVLWNLIGVTSKREMDRAEFDAQYRALQEFFGTYDREHRFTAQDIMDMHRVWLGGIYPWAGEYRRVDLARNGITLAVPARIPALMEEFEHGLLREYTPCLFTTPDKIIEALAVVHADLMLIHPFRAGNGRLARILAVLMGLQVGLPPLEFAAVKGQALERYYAAVRAGLSKDYRPMMKVFADVIARTLRLARGSIAE